MWSSLIWQCSTKLPVWFVHLSSAPINVQQCWGQVTVEGNLPVVSKLWGVFGLIILLQDESSSTQIKPQGGACLWNMERSLSSVRVGSDLKTAPDLNLPTTIFHCGFEPLMSFSAVDTHWPTFYKELVLELQAQPPYKDLVQPWFERFSLQSTIWPLPLHFWILKPSDYFRVYVTNKRLLMRPQTVGLCCVRARYINYSNHKKRLTLTTKSCRPCNHFWKLVLSLDGAIKDFIFIIMGIKSWTMLDRIIVTWDFYIVP